LLEISKFHLKLINYTPRHINISKCGGKAVRFLILSLKWR
jgi:hypothetical protein